VNTRADVAIAAGAAGVSFALGIACSAILAPAGFLIGVSCHSVEDVRQAEAEGADYVVFGPVFPANLETCRYRTKGWTASRVRAAAVRIPVLALGGVTEENSAACVSAGAAGIAEFHVSESFAGLLKFDS